MIPLPPIQLAGHAANLPLSEDSAREIAAILLREDTSEHAALWTELLSVDPPLLLWAALHHTLAGASSPATIATVAQWIAPRALQFLNWAGPTASAAELPPSESTRWREVVQQTLLAAEQASELHAPGGIVPPLVALLRAMGESEFFIPAEALPGWMSELPSAKEAQPTAPEELSPHIKRELRRWRTKTAGSGSMLPRLTQRLRKLQALETDFDHTLLTEKLSAMRELAYGASHEINNPLANISTRAQTLLQEETDPERRRKLATIHLQAMRAHEMIANLMHFAKPPRLNLEPIDLNEVLAAALAELSDWAREQGTLLTMHASPRPCLVQGDRQQLLIALRALLRNSLEALAAGGQVEARCLADQWATVRVRDNGPGVSPEARGHMFDPFYSGREAGRGLGFGLAWCWRIMERHGGRIQVNSEPGHGAEFRLELPLARVQIAETT